MTFRRNSDFVDASDIVELAAVFGRIPPEAKADVRKANRQAANLLRDRIRPAMPRTGGMVKGKGARKRLASAKKKTGPKHQTKTGSMRLSVRSKASYNYAEVLGGGTSKAPHFGVNEFGGAVWWRGSGSSAKSTSRHVSQARKRSLAGGEFGTFFGRLQGHMIFIRTRSPMNHIKTWKSEARSGAPVIKSKAFPSGWFFYGTAAEHLPEALAFHSRAIAHTTRTLFSKV